MRFLFVLSFANTCCGQTLKFLLICWQWDLIVPLIHISLISSKWGILISFCPLVFLSVNWIFLFLVHFSLRLFVFFFWFVSVLYIVWLILGLLYALQIASPTRDLYLHSIYGVFWWTEAYFNWSNLLVSFYWLLFLVLMKSSALRS